MANELLVDNPFTGHTAAAVALADLKALDAVITRAVATQKDIAAATLAERLTVCELALGWFATNEARVAGEMTAMTGKPLQQSEGEIRGMAARARHMMAIAEQSLADVSLPKQAGLDRRIQRVPWGVVLNLPAYNYPLLTAVNAVVPAILCGNSVLLKHSPRSPLCGDHFAAAFDVGATGWVQSIHCDNPTIAKVAGDPRIGYVAFTGSIGGGRAIYQAVAQSSFSDVGLELGGNDAAFVHASANPEAVAASLVEGACYNGGQSCCAVERVYADASIYKRLIEACRQAMVALTLDDPLKRPDIGPMAQPQTIGKLTSHVEDATTRGARLVVGGAACQVDGQGRFFQPTLLADCDAKMLIMRDESFGPLLPIQSVNGEHEALALMNDSHLGLTASIWSQDADVAYDMAGSLEVGTVLLNRCDTLDPGLPWTGVKQSGKGSSLSHLGFQHLTRPRALNFKLPT